MSSDLRAAAELIVEYVNQTITEGHRLAPPTQAAKLLADAYLAEHDDEGQTAAEDLLERLVRAVCYSDSYGVHGSSFQFCTVCQGGGSPYVKFEHAADCVVNEAEKLLTALGVTRD